MNGGDVFNFVIKEIPRDFRSLLEYSNTDLTSIDYFIFHQANTYINGYLAKKLKLDLAKVPSSIEKFGNTSSVSIPLTIISELKDKLRTKKKLMFSGFGVGMTWATAILNLDDCFISPIIEV